MATARPLIEIQQRWSRLPGPDELLIERVRTGDGHHVFVYPFDGRLVHEGLAALVASRLAARRPVTVNVTANDYGFELLSGDPIEADEETWRWLLSADRLVEDLLACLNATQLARRRFRDIARVAGLILPGYPGEGRPVRHLQASSELFFDVFSDFDPGNMLLDQARREVLEEQLEVRRLKTTLDRIAGLRIVTEEPERLTPLAFPLWTEGLRQEQVSSETWSDRVSKMVVTLEEAASTEAPRGRSTDGRRRERAVRAGKRTGKRAGGPGDG
jgi:ATP-dependent Lhr-like helicase